MSDDLERQTYSTGTGPICPYCGHENASAGNDYWAEEAGSGTDECGECGREYRFHVDFTTHYYARPTADNETVPERRAGA